jgi:signal transduction histidine kinase
VPGPDVPEPHSHPRPPWWPDDEPWPPERWGPPYWRRRGWGGQGRATEGEAGEGGAAEGREARQGAEGGHWDRQAWGGPGAWGGSGGRSGMRRGFGCLIVMMATLIVSVGVLVLWLLAGLLGIASLEGSLADLARPAGLVVLVVGIVALVVGIRIARGVGRPLSELVDAAGRIEAADYSVRVGEEQGRGELRRLSHAFNEMAARLEAEDATRRRLLADVSHELRTPLAVVQGNLEALLDGIYPSDDAHIRPILDETRVLERLIDDLRTVSLAESGALPLHREPMDPAVLLEDVATAHRARATAAGIDLRVIGATGLGPVEVDPVRLHQVVSNLVDNAIRAMPDGGSIALSAAPLPNGGLALEVTDDGPGIPDDIRDAVFERFTKSASSRGSGLGLAIARAIVEAHGGRISAAPAHPGASLGSDSPEGTRIRIELPASGR